VKAQAVLIYEESIELRLDLPDDGFTDADVIAAAQEVEPFREFTHVLLVEPDA
jgi:hypothetical protein